MPRVGKEAVRREQLVEATLALIHEQGIEQTTVAQISARAGLSNGMVHHYFANKDALMEATLRSLNRRLCRDINKRLAAAQTPMERIYAIVDGNLRMENFTSPAVSAWLAFWSRVPTAPRLARVHNAIRRRFHSNMMFALRQLVDEKEAERIALSLAVFVDGLWLRAAVDPGGMSASTALYLAYEMIDELLPTKKVRPHSNRIGRRPAR